MCVSAYIYLFIAVLLLYTCISLVAEVCWRGVDPEGTRENGFGWDWAVPEASAVYPSQSRAKWVFSSLFAPHSSMCYGLIPKLEHRTELRPFSIIIITIANNSAQEDQSAEVKKKGK